jgi:lipid-A-disaccharide synthase
VKPKQIMLIAGEASGDLLAAELVAALREELAVAESSYSPDAQPLKTGLEPRFFGAGGSRMKAAGVELAFDLTQHSVIGLSDVLKNYFKFRRLFHELFRLAIARQPDAIIGVDYGGFNLRFAHAIRQYILARSDWFHGWRPKIIQYVSPQVWASRAVRAHQLAHDHDLVLCIFPFEREWYAQRVPGLHVEFVGHPMLDRLPAAQPGSPAFDHSPTSPEIILLPGSRVNELRRHLPAVLGAFELIRQKLPETTGKLILPNGSLPEYVKSFRLKSDRKIQDGIESAEFGAGLEIQIGALPEALARADLAIASTGTVTMECAWFGVPTVTLYKTSWSTYQIGKRIVTVNSLTMPNLLAGETVYPEFIQDAATPENISRAALELLQDEPRRAQIRKRLKEIVAPLGGPGASRRAAKAITRLLTTDGHE